MASGLLVGLAMMNHIVVMLTSFQILLFSLALVFATRIGVGQMTLWCVLGLFGHQAAFLAGLIIRNSLGKAERQRPAPVSAKIDTTLAHIETLAERIAALAPAPANEDAQAVSRLVSEVRLTLEKQEDLEALLVERRRSSASG